MTKIRKGQREWQKKGNEREKRRLEKREEVKVVAGKRRENNRREQERREQKRGKERKGEMIVEEKKRWDERRGEETDEHWPNLKNGGAGSDPCENSARNWAILIIILWTSAAPGGVCTFCTQHSTLRLNSSIISPFHSSPLLSSALFCYSLFSSQQLPLLLLSFLVFSSLPPFLFSVTLSFPDFCHSLSIFFFFFITLSPFLFSCYYLFSHVLLHTISRCQPAVIISIQIDLWIS